MERIESFLRDSGPTEGRRAHVASALSLVDIRFLVKVRQCRMLRPSISSVHSCCAGCYQCSNN